VHTTTDDTLQDPTTSIPSRCPPLKPINEICRNGKISYYPHPYDCSKFVQCAHQISYVRRCPSNLLWHHQYKTCDWPRNVECCQNSIFSCPPQKPLENICEDGQMFQPHPTHCSRFIRCLNNRPYENYCVNGLLWNVRKNMCDWPDNVTCCPYQYQNY